jgi:hypothetical protein
MRIRPFASAVLILFALVAVAGPGRAEKRAAAPTPSEASLNSCREVWDQTPLSMQGTLVEQIVAIERDFAVRMQKCQPLVETYVQNLKSKRVETSEDERSVVPTRVATEPVSDRYFLGRMEMTQGVQHISFMGSPGVSKRAKGFFSGMFSLKYLPLGFAQMVFVDADFNTSNYDFRPRGTQFLGEVKCLMYDVEPKPAMGAGRFQGRIWVEAQEHHIVRFNGTFSRKKGNKYYLHFDSWRTNLRPHAWLPSYIYSEESDLKHGVSQRFHFKAQTRLWGYDRKHLGEMEEFTNITPETANVKDTGYEPGMLQPRQAQRQWEREAEDNALDRLERAGLLATQASAGPVENWLCGFATKLKDTKKSLENAKGHDFDVQLPIRCRVLLTSQLETFTIGHTIVVSRGLLDVLPNYDIARNDEPSKHSVNKLVDDDYVLAAVLAHEVGHIVNGDQVNTKLASPDRFFFPDESSFQKLSFYHNDKEESAADAAALELLNNTPEFSNKDRQRHAGLFLNALKDRAPELKNLIRPHLGNPLGNPKTTREASLTAGAPAEDRERLEQVSAFPLGGIVQLDPWSNQVNFLGAPVIPYFAYEKMPFETTPFYPYLRYCKPDDNNDCPTIRLPGPGTAPQAPSQPGAPPSPTPTPQPQ